MFISPAYLDILSSYSVDNNKKVLESDLKILGNYLMDKFEESNEFFLTDLTNFGQIGKINCLYFNDIKLVTPNLDNIPITIIHEKQPSISRKYLELRQLL